MHEQRSLMIPPIDLARLSLPPSFAMSLCHRLLAAGTRCRRCIVSIGLASLTLAGCGDFTSAPSALTDNLRPRFVGGDSCENEPTLEARMYCTAERYLDSADWFCQEYGYTLWSHLESDLGQYSNHAFAGPNGQLALGTSNQGDGYI